MFHVNVKPEDLNNIVEFGCPFRVTAFGEVVTGQDLDRSEYVPEIVSYIENNDYSAEIAPWHTVNGYSGQQGYSGPVMHSSEYLGGGMARDVLETPGLYAVIMVEDDIENEYGEMDAVGWMLLRIEE